MQLYQVLGFCVASIRASAGLEIGSETVVVIVSILALCIYVIVATILIMLFWNRANKIRALGEESHFTLIPIAVILIRLIGEVGFLLLIGLGIQGLLVGLGIQGLLSDSGILDVLQYAMPPELWRIKGLGFIAGVITLVVFYYQWCIGIDFLVFHSRVNQSICGYGYQSQED